MKFYCMCDKSRNKFIKLEESENMNKEGVVVLYQMYTDKTGVPQFLEDNIKPRRHYPNVDILKCYGCGATIVME